MAQNLTNQDWRSLAAQASTEQDSARLTSLVTELCRSLDERQKTPRFQRQEENQESQSKSRLRLAARKPS
jgi:hypothetical protein